MAREITSCETQIEVHGLSIDVRVMWDPDNNRYMAQVYDEKFGEYTPYVEDADDDWWYDTEAEALAECKSQLSNDYVMGCGIFFEEDEILCPDCDVPLIDKYECPNCGKFWDPEDLDLI